MPIKPENKKKYPPDWKGISLSVKESAGWKCENCGAPHGVVGKHGADGVFYAKEDIDGMNSSMGFQLFGNYPKVIRIILTVAHLNHNPADNRRENLRAWCQKCHLAWDKEHHMKNSKETRIEKIIDAIKVAWGI
jgi:hypothetical protein